MFFVSFYTKWMQSNWNSVQCYRPYSDLYVYMQHDDDDDEQYKLWNKHFRFFFSNSCCAGSIYYLLMLLFILYHFTFYRVFYVFFVFVSCFLIKLSIEELTRVESGNYLKSTSKFQFVSRYYKQFASLRKLIVREI